MPVLIQKEKMDFVKISKCGQLMGIWAMGAQYKKIIIT
jgi:hypothetical protein